MKPWLWLPPQWAHGLAPAGLTLLAQIYGQPTPRWRSLKWQGLDFPNPAGIAGGVDKTGTSLFSWSRLGAGFLELGTVTPKAQKANPGKILDRDVSRQIVWNKMGFPSPGLDAIEKQLWRLPKPFPVPLFINIGKNRHTELSQASGDYAACLNRLHDFADAFVINISSPNTTGLRELQKRDYFQNFLTNILNQYSKKQSQLRPILLKVSPEVDDSELENILRVGLKLGLAGFILTNSTQRRPYPNGFPPQGGFSGTAVKDLSEHLLTRSCEILGTTKSKVLLVSVGGILTATDVERRLQMGANLVQVYSTLLFSGPFFFQDLAKHFSS